MFHVTFNTISNWKTFVVNGLVTYTKLEWSTMLTYIPHTISNRLCFDVALVTKWIPSSYYFQGSIHKSRMAVSIAWILYSAMYLRNCEKYCGGNIWIWSTSINSYRLVSIIEIAHLKLCLDANICMYYALTFMSKNTQQILLRST